MVNQVNKIPSTTSYKYGNNDVEYVLCSRGRPFVTLVSPNKPTPTSTLMDHNLVKELGLKISDLQCKKYFYCGEQLRLLGTVSTTVQCVMDGFVCSSFQFRANVIEHLSTNFGVHSIAGMKLTKMLQPMAVNKNGHHCTSSGAPSPAPKSLPSTPKKVSTTPPMCRTVSPPPGFEVNPKDSSNLFLVQWDAALADAEEQCVNSSADDQPEPADVGNVESVPAVPASTKGEQAEPVKITLLEITSPSADVWPGGVNSNQPIPWCHPDAQLVPWLVDGELTPNILCVNGIPSHYARGTCNQCQSPINPDDTIDPNVSMCSNCYIKEEIQRRRKRK